LITGIRIDTKHLDRLQRQTNAVEQHGQRLP
jgi:hypothetical protein